MDTTVFLVDDDAVFRRYTAECLRKLAGTPACRNPAYRNPAYRNPAYRNDVQQFSTAEDFLAAVWSDPPAGTDGVRIAGLGTTKYRPFPHPGCLLLDIEMPGMSGLELHQQFTDNGLYFPVIIISGHGDIPSALSATKSGAVNFLEKPFRPDELLASVRAAIDFDRLFRQHYQECVKVQQLMSALTSRETDVVYALLERGTTGRTAVSLGIKEQTVRNHIGSILEKTNLESVTELLKPLQQLNSPWVPPDLPPTVPSAGGR